MVDRTQPAQKRVAYVNRNALNKPSCLVKIGRFKTRALCDTGADVSLISYQLYLQLRRQLGEAKEGDVLLVGANGEKIENVGMVELTLTIGTESLTRSFHVVPDLGHSVILGWDTITQEGMVIDGSGKQLRFRNLTIDLQKDEQMSSLVRLTEDLTLYPQTATFCKAKRARYSAHQNGIYLTEAAESGVLADEPGLMIACSLNHIEGGRTFGIRLVNNTNRTYHLKKGNVVGKVEPVQGDYSVREVLNVDNIKNCPVESPGQVKPEDAGKPKPEYSTLEELLEANADLFAESDLELGRTHLVHMDIDTGNHPPITGRPYRAPLAKRRIIEDKVDEMLEAGIISESRSPWTSPVVLVGKKDGGERFCVDYRRINGSTTRYNYPLPHIDDILAALGGSCVFSSLDLRSGYLQLPMNEGSKEKTAFICHRGIYCFNVMPFGLLNAPSYFCELMAKVLYGIDGKFTTAYLDDIIIWSRNKAEHLRHLQEVFDRLRAAGLKLKRSKCSFFREELTYLGHVVTPNGVKPCKDKVAVIENLSPPKNAREVRSLIGMVSYYRRYVPKFSEIARPLTALTKKGADFLWTSGCQVAFETLKQKLCVEPILAFPDMTKPFIVYSDASEIAIGSVLVQDYEEGPRAVYYISHALTPTQSRWSTIEREAYAIIYAINRFRPFLYGNSFVIRCDHRPLRYIFGSEVKNAKVQNWAMQLSEYDCKIEYISGSKNAQADFLSRLNPPSPVLEKGVNVINTDQVAIQYREIGEAVEESENELPNLAGDEPLDMAAEQAKDRGLGRFSRDAQYTKLNGILYYIAEEPVAGLKLVIPQHLRSLVLKECHDNLGHMGLDKTYDRIRQKYHWRGIYKDIVRYVADCVPCNTRNLKQQAAPLQEMDKVSMPFQKVAMDMCGPYDTSYGGNRFLLTFVDMYSGWPEFYPLPDKSAEGVADIILTKIIPRHGCCLRLLSDNGGEFVNKVVGQVCKTLKIYRIRTSPYRPQSNGKLERIHRVWNDIVGKQLKDRREWDLMIPSALMALRTCNHETTQHSPFYLMNGRDPWLPLDTLLRPRAKYMGEEHHEHVLERHHKAMVVVQRNHQKAVARTKRYHDRKAKESNVQVDDPVYLFKTKRNSKLEPRWEPYFRVVEKVTPVNFVVRNVVTGAMRKAHAAHLRKANLDWSIPQVPEGRRPLRQVAQAAGPSDTDVAPESDISWSSEDDIPLARIQERLHEESLSSGDDIPLARLRDLHRSAIRGEVINNASSPSDEMVGEVEQAPEAPTSVAIPQVAPEVTSQNYSRMVDRNPVEPSAGNVGAGNVEMQSSTDSGSGEGPMEGLEAGKTEKRGRISDSSDETSASKSRKVNAVDQIREKAEKETKMKTFLAAMVALM